MSKFVKWAALVFAGFVLALCSGGKAHAQAQLRTCSSGPGVIVPGLNSSGQPSNLCVAAQAVINATAMATTSTAGVIVAANTYQQALAASSSRYGCMIANTSSDTLRVFLGDPTLATDAMAIPIPPGSTFNCASPGGLIVVDQIAVAAPSAGDTFVVLNQ